MAQTIDTIGQIGKGGISNTMVESFSMALEKRELIKLTVLDNSEEDVDLAAQNLAKLLNAEVVCTIGKKIVLYRKSKRDINHIKF